MLKAEKLDEIEAKVLSLEEYNKSLFDAEIRSSLKVLRIEDARDILYRYDIITELKSEISQDQVESIVVSFLKAASKEINVPQIDLTASQSYIHTYTNRISSVIEASKFRTDADAKLNFSSFRITPGVFIFVYAYSEKYKLFQDTDSQIITSTALLIRLKISVNDVKNQAEYDAKRIDQESLLKIKYIQASLLEELFRKEFGIKTWKVYDKNFLKVVNRINSRLDKNARTNKMQIGSNRKSSPELVKLVNGLIKKLESLNDASLDEAIEVSKNRLVRSYY